MTNDELRNRATHFFASVGATGFAAVVNFAHRDECIILVADFPPQLGADMLASLARSMSETPPAKLN